MTTTVLTKRAFLKPATLVRVLVILAAAAALLVAGGGQPAYAAAITVTTTDDELNTDGDCSLREAIQAANTDTGVDACTVASGVDTIGFSVTGTITLSNGELVINQNLTIQGPGAANLAISGNNASRVFSITTGTVVTISGITIRNGNSASFGGGIFNDGGTLTLTNSTVSNNTATNAGGGTSLARAR